MAQTQEIRQAIDSMAGRGGPMLSAYVSVNAAIPENQGQAYLVRLRDAMNDAGVPEGLQERVRGFVEDETHPGARTLAVFADEDGLFEFYRLQADLPESVRWGDPNVAPLALVLEEYEAYGAAVLDGERFRYFVVSPLVGGEEGGDTKANGFREVDVNPAEPYPRGGMDQESSSRRTEANVHKFYNQLGELTRDLTLREGVKRLILAGPRERTAEFRGLLPNEVKDRVVAEEPVDLGAPEGELLDRLEEIRERAEHEREGELLARIQEGGVRGPEETIKALQEENRVYHLAALWDLEGEVRWSDADGLAIMDITQEKSPFSGEPTRVRPLTDVLVDLASARGARLDFMRGENENTDTLRDEFGGLAGLTRF
ncbi:MAG: hypothetical protein AVDCRST_MAG03-3437 [uncultured Rubrobacteraceae bacterium]|uniref:Peptide chain release factor 3 n=1 Tax=uncultured Rubrobacteraceae bacterium TaxID=349277 RepID=A0A6J4QC73_9ACTN|nr:MAG: hypothetical protein AVDCRST_MAG03-3437 [uncultured Rubrobacteraceae bacterium]